MTANLSMLLRSPETYVQQRLLQDPSLMWLEITFDLECWTIAIAQESVVLRNERIILEEYLEYFAETESGGSRQMVSWLDSLMTLISSGRWYRQGRISVGRTPGKNAWAPDSEKGAGKESLQAKSVDRLRLRWANCVADDARSTLGALN